MEEGSTNIFAAIANNNKAAFDTALKTEGFDINQKNAELKTPLDFAIMSINLGMVEALLVCGANVNAANKEGLTPLHTLIKAVDAYVEKGVAAEKVLDVVKQLLQKGANVMLQDRRGNTLINYVAQKAKHGRPTTELYTKIGKMVLRHDKKAAETVRIKNNMGKSPLDYLSRNHNSVLRDVVYEYLAGVQIEETHSKQLEPVH